MPSPPPPPLAKKTGDGDFALGESDAKKPLSSFSPRLPLLQGWSELFMVHILAAPRGARVPEARAKAFSVAKVVFPQADKREKGLSSQPAIGLGPFKREELT